MNENNQCLTLKEKLQELNLRYSLLENKFKQSLTESELDKIKTELSTLENELERFKQEEVLNTLKQKIIEICLKSDIHIDIKQVGELFEIKLLDSYDIIWQLCPKILNYIKSIYAYDGDLGILILLEEEISDDLIIPNIGIFDAQSLKRFKNLSFRGESKIIKLPQIETLDSIDVQKEKVKSVEIKCPIDGSDLSFLGLVDRLDIFGMQRADKLVLPKGLEILVLKDLVDASNLKLPDGLVKLKLPKLEHFNTQLTFPYSLQEICLNSLTSIKNFKPISNCSFELKGLSNRQIRNLMKKLSKKFTTVRNVKFIFSRENLDYLAEKSLGNQYEKMFKDRNIRIITSI